MGSLREVLLHSRQKAVVVHQGFPLPEAAEHRQLAVVVVGPHRQRLS